jgi:hypothetical protein
MDMEEWQGGANHPFMKQNMVALTVHGGRASIEKKGYSCNVIEPTLKGIPLVHCVLNRLGGWERCDILVDGLRATVNQRMCGIGVSSNEVDNGGKVNTLAPSMENHVHGLLKHEKCVNFRYCFKRLHDRINKSAANQSKRHAKSISIA